MGNACGARALVKVAARHEIVEVLHGSWSGSGRDNDIIYPDVGISRPDSARAAPAPTH